MTDLERVSQTVYAKLEEMGPATRLHAQVELTVIRALSQASPDATLHTVWNSIIFPELQKAFHEHQRDTRDLNERLMQLSGG